MSSRKRLPSEFLSLKQVYQGAMKQVEDNKIFFLGNRSISRVRVFGVILSRFDNISSNDTPYVSLLLDDGTDTIYLRFWESEYGSALTAKIIMEQAKSGQIVDVIGKIREFNDQRYIAPELISLNKTIQWEMHRRLLRLVDTYNQVELEDLDLIETSDEIKDGAEKILNVMLDNIDENTSEKLSARANLSLSETEEIIVYLRMEDFIITPRAGKFKKL